MFGFNAVKRIYVAAFHHINLCNGDHQEQATQHICCYLKLLSAVWDPEQFCILSHNISITSTIQAGLNCQNECRGGMYLLRFRHLYGKCAQSTTLPSGTVLTAKIWPPVSFSHNNVPAHWALATRKKLAYPGFRCLDHQPYSLDLAPSDYYLFSGLKKQLKGRHISSDVEVIAAAEIWLDGQTEFLFWVVCTI